MYDKIHASPGQVDILQAPILPARTLPLYPAYPDCLRNQKMPLKAQLHRHNHTVLPLTLPET